MKFVKINSLTPDGEPFDETAVGEGIWLSANHMAALESALTNGESVVTERDSKIRDMEAQLSATQNLLERSEEANSGLRSQNQIQATEIERLQAEVTELGNEPSGNGSSVSTTEDPAPDAAPQPSYLSDDNPINAWVDQKIKRQS